MHSDHARWGCQKYLAAKPGEHVLRLRMSADAEFQFLPYGESLVMGGVEISFHPAGHILGSAQIRLEYRGHVVLITGDYKLGTDPTCEAWQPIRCHSMISESTFGLPIYRWPSPESVFQSINQWWRECRDEGKCCLLYGYAIGKSQRLLAGLDPTIGKIYCHGAVEKGNQQYRRTGIALARHNACRFGRPEARLERFHDRRRPKCSRNPLGQEVWLLQYGDGERLDGCAWCA